MSAPQNLSAPLFLLDFEARAYRALADRAPEDERPRLIERAVQCEYGAKILELYQTFSDSPPASPASDHSDPLPQERRICAAGLPTTREA